MINVNKYNNYDAYAADGNRPVGENCVSLVGNAVVYEGKNIIKTKSQLGRGEVCMVVKDTVDGDVKYIPVVTFDPDTFDSDRYMLKDWIRFGECMGKSLHMYKTNIASTTWAAPNRYKVECDLTANGGFDWAITINGTARSGSVEWEAGDTLEEVAAQINAVVSIASVVDGDDFVRITVNSYSNSTLTLTDVTGATLTDLSIYCKIDGVAQEETHRTWQAQSVASLFPSLGFNAANTKLYGENGLNMSYYAGANLARYKAVYRTLASANVWVAEASGRMNEATFEACADGTIGGDSGIALYEKYNGDWDAYMEAGMVHIDDVNSDGVEYQSYANGLDQAEKLCSVTTMDFDGEYVAAYTAASAAALTDADLGVSHLPTVHECAMFMDDDTYALIRMGLGYLTGVTQLSNAGYYWLVAEYYAYSAWLYNGNNGILYNYGKRSTNSVRPVLAS